MYLKLPDSLQLSLEIREIKYTDTGLVRATPYVYKSVVGAITKKHCWETIFPRSKSFRGFASAKITIRAQWRSVNLDVV